MACVTLKRPIDVLGSPHLSEIQPLAKRKRCGPPLFATTPSPNRGVKRAKRRLDVDDAYSPNSGPSSPVRSPFLGAVPPTEPGILVHPPRRRQTQFVYAYYTCTWPFEIRSWQYGLFKNCHLSLIAMFVVLCFPETVVISDFSLRATSYSYYYTWHNILQPSICIVMFVVQPAKLCCCRCTW